MKAASDGERRLVITAAGRIPRGTAMFQMSLFEGLETRAQHIALVAGNVTHRGDLRQEGRGIGLEAKFKTYMLQDDQQLDTVDGNPSLGFAADLHDYGLAAQMLKMLDVHQIDLITNNPQRVSDLHAHGIDVVSVIPSEVTVTGDNTRYLQTKRVRRGQVFHDTGSCHMDPCFKRW